MPDMFAAIKSIIRARGDVKRVFQVYSGIFPDMDEKKMCHCCSVQVIR